VRGAYVFRVRFRLDAPRIRTEPEELSAVVGVPAPEPPAGGDDGGAAGSDESGPGETDAPDDRATGTDAPIEWTFFQTALWRGEATDDRRVRQLCSELLSVDATAASFAELALDAAYREALRAAIGRDPGRFNAADADEALAQHLGSSIRVVDEDEPLPPN